MKIAFISSEAYPYVKTGGLADVSYSLPLELARSGHEVLLFLPRYYAVDRERFQLKQVGGPLGVPMGNGEKWAALLQTQYIPDLTTFFIEYEGYFGRDGLYDDGYRAYDDNAERFIFFSRAVLHAMKDLEFSPDIVHCNDWQTALVPVYLKTLYAKDPFYALSASLLTVHNAGYQGVYPGELFYLTQLGWDVFNPEGLEFFSQMNFLKGGLQAADAVTTVSPRHARELQTREYGYDLAGVFRNIHRRLYGILNGIDSDKWDPASDPMIPARYTIEDLVGKALCKNALQAKMNLPLDSRIPIMGTISRVTHQKGMDMLADTLFHMMSDDDFQFIMLGSGDEEILRRFELLRKMFPHRVGLLWGFDEELAHWIEAGLDIYLMPSRYEPCGLNQMYSLRYGTIPVVRATGGLDDTVQHWDPVTFSGNGFKFDLLTDEVLYNTLRWVLRNYRDEKTWAQLVRNAMAFSYRWKDAVAEYEKVYSSILKRSAGSII